MKGLVNPSERSEIRKFSKIEITVKNESFGQRSKLPKLKYIVKIFKRLVRILSNGIFLKKENIICLSKNSENYKTRSEILTIFRKIEIRCNSKAIFQDLQKFQDNISRQNFKIIFQDKISR